MHSALRSAHGALRGTRTGTKAGTKARRHAGTQARRDTLTRPRARKKISGALIPGAHLCFATLDGLVHLGIRAPFQDPPTHANPLAPTHAAFPAQVCRNHMARDTRTAEKMEAKLTKLTMGYKVGGDEVCP